MPTRIYHPHGRYQQDNQRFDIIYTKRELRKLNFRSPHRAGLTWLSANRREYALTIGFHDLDVVNFWGWLQSEQLQQELNEYG